MVAELGGLEGRSREVLASVVCAHIRSAAPVSSRQLMEAGTFGLSAASLRNAMAELEDQGFLTHPHVSAGRVPTDRGYRTFVDELMPSQPPSAAERARVTAELSPESFDLQRLLVATSRLVSALTGEVGVVSARRPAIVLEAVHFTRVSERKVLLVEVHEPGLVDSRLIETREDYSPRELEDISRRLTADYAGRPLPEIRARIMEALEEEKVRFDAALNRMLPLARQAFGERSEEQGSTLFVEGTENIFEKPEFQTDVEALRLLFHAFDEKVRLVNLLTDCLSKTAATVVIGSENPFTGKTGSAVVSAPIRQNDRILGFVGVLGPRRLEYARVVPMVEELSRFVSRRLTEVAS